MGLSHNDNGYKSRKWVGLLLVLVMIFVGSLVVPVAALGTAVSGMVMAYGVYCGVNVGRDVAALKNGATILPPPDKTLPLPKKDADKDEGS